jgi:hypothetical protein
MFWFVVALMLSGCVEKMDSIASYATHGRGAAGVCQDDDGDGFGEGCDEGPDCDDSDRWIHEGCRCVRIDEGCACEPGQEPVACELEPTEDEHGYTVCHEGTRFCRNGVWTACESVFSFLSGGANAAGLVDPGCHAQCGVCSVNCYRVSDPLDPVDGGPTGDNSSCVDFADGGGIVLRQRTDGGSADCDYPDAGTGGGADAGSDAGTEGGADAGADAGTDSDTDAGPDGGTDAGTGETCVVRQCQDKTYACGDCVDNDGDGLTDADDPECLGACQNAEDTFAGNIPGQNNAPCKHDCYFDKDTGHGNDGCLWDHRCDALAPQNGCEYDPTVNIPGTQLSCSELADGGQSRLCIDTCEPLTPPGCDYFGCCELPSGSGNFVWIGSEDENGDPSCDSTALSDADRCHPCTPVNDYLKPCGECELCAGMTELPAHCATEPDPPEPPTPDPEPDPEPQAAPYAIEGTYSQLIDFNECVSGYRPDWQDFTFVASIPGGTAIEFSACTASSTTDLVGCTPELVARVISGGACESDADCTENDGYCAPDGLCQFITGPTCESDADCGSAATCDGNRCAYADQPVDIAGSLSVGSNYLPFINVRIKLSADPSGSRSPVLYQWVLTYVCTSIE